MEDQEGQEIEGKTDETQFGQKIPAEPQQEEPKPLTTEETLQKEIAELRTKYEQTDKGLRSAQATLTQKDRLLKERENVRDEIETLKNMVKILATQQNSGDDDFETTAKKKNPDIDKSFEELEQRQKAQEYQRKLTETIDSYRQRVEAVGLTEKDEGYWEIYKLVTNATPADFRLADIRLGKLEAEKEKTPVDNKPTDEAKKLEVALKEIERLKKVVSGELDTETGLPSGASATEAQIKENLRKNPRSKANVDAYLEMKRNKKK